MRRTLLKLSVTAVLLAGTAVGAKRPLETPTTDEDFGEIVGKLKTEAGTFAGAADDKGPSPSKVVAKLQYLAKSAVPLVKALRTLPGKPIEKMYIAWQLLQPLKMADNETIRPLRPVLAAMLQNDCQYKPMPKWFKSTLPNAARKKIAAERAVVKHNRTVNSLEKIIKQILVMMDDPTADEAILKRLAFEEARRLIAFEQTLSAIKSEAGRMKQDRAKKYYDRLKAMAYRSGRQKQYADPTEPVYDRTKTSSFKTRKAYFAASVLRVVNVVATSAKQPALKIPGVKDRKDRKKPPRPRR